MARENFSEEIFELTPEWQVGDSHAKYDPGRENSKCKGHEVGEERYIYATSCRVLKVMIRSLDFNLSSTYINTVKSPCIIYYERF